MVTKFQDKKILNDLMDRSNLLAIKHDHFKAFAKFILENKQDAMVIKEVKERPEYYAPTNYFEHTIELNVFTNDELKEFMEQHKRRWLKHVLEWNG